MFNMSHEVANILRGAEERPFLFDWLMSVSMASWVAMQLQIGGVMERN